MVDDITRRLRLSAEPEAVDRERRSAESIFQAALRDCDFGEKNLSPEKVRHLAKSSIEAACAFWEEWDIAVLTPEATITEDQTR